MKYSSVKFESKNILEWQKDLLIVELAGIGFDTFEDSECGFVGYIPTTNLNISEVERIILQNAEGYEINYSVQDLDDQNWNKLWESNFEPILIDGKCYVKATFHPQRDDVEFEIEINPKMSFGTGHHQTTSMMLSYLLESDLSESKVLDMGCGTGILSILASKKGAEQILAVDFDEICVESTKENMMLNQVENIEPVLGSVDQVRKNRFDVILANINRNILIDHLPSYSKLIKDKGLLIISGFYDGDDLVVLKQKAQTEGFRFECKKVIDHWCAAKFEKQNL